jgi:uncharacterized SAM-binding protein YcdF (DUF218 family)
MGSNIHFGRELPHLRRWIGAGIGLIAVVFAWLVAPAALRAAAQLWLISDPLEPVDVIVVLGGGLDIRPESAAALYKRGMAPLVVVGVSRYDQGEHAELNRNMLMKFGVPAHAIVEFPFQPHNTYGEALGLLRWARDNGVKKVLIPVEIFQTRRVKWIFDRELSADRIRVIVQAVTLSPYNTNNWWLRKDGLINFRNEVIKLFYYRLRY